MKQAKLPGVVPPHMQRLEEIEDELDEIAEKTNKLRDKKNELEEEALGLWTENKLTGVRRRGADEWYVDAGKSRYRRRRVKQPKKKGEGDGTEASPERERATA